MTRLELKVVARPDDTCMIISCSALHRAILRPPTAPPARQVNGSTLNVSNLKTPIYFTLPEVPITPSAASNTSGGDTGRVAQCAFYGECPPGRPQPCGRPPRLQLSIVIAPVNCAPPLT